MAEGNNADVKITTIKLNDATVALNNSITLTPTIVPDNATNKSLTWSSSDDSIATVDENGTVKGIKTGTAQITAIANDGSNISASCKITLQSIEIITDGKTLNKTVGDTDTLEYTILPPVDNANVKWSSSNESVVTIDQNGKIDAKSEGKAIITLATGNGKLIDTCEIIVNAPDETLALSESEKELYLGESYKLSCTKQPDKKTITWESSNPNIATVDDKGNVTAKGVGKAVISVQYKDDNGTINDATCTVTVPEPIKLDKKNLDIFKGKSTILNVTVKAADNPAVTWSTTDDNSVGITPTGYICTVNGIAKGETTVQAAVTIAGNTYKDSCKVQVAETREEMLAGIVDNFIPQYKEVTNKYALTVNVRFEDDGVTKNIEQVLTQGEEVSLEVADRMESFLLTEISFHKEVYRPGCLEATIKTGAPLSVFSGMVALKYNEDAIAEKYYIFEKKKKRGYVTFRAYSVDKFLTIDKFCRAFTGKRLVENIVVDTIITMQDSPNFKQYYTNITLQEKDKSTHSAGVVKNLNHLINNNIEALLPYCVQYNESFYDFLVRICNRNGEFLYCEDNKLHVGVAIDTTNSTEIKEEDGVEIELNESGWEYADYTKTMASNYLDNGSMGKVYDNNGEAGDNSNTNLVNGEGIYPDEYFEQLDKDFKYVGWSDLWPHVELVGDTFKTLANAPTLYTGLSGLALKSAVRSTITSVFVNQINDGYKKYAGVFALNNYYEFATKDHLLTNEKFYKKIFQAQENAEEGKVIVTCTTCQKYKLGQTVKIDNQYYVVYKVEGSAKIKDGIVEGVKRYTESYELLLLPLAEENNEYKAYPLPMPELRIRKASPQRATVKVNFDPKRIGRIRVSYPWQSNDDKNFTPWIRVAYPMASNESGFMFFPKAGDEVLIDYEGGNIERPFMVGSFYNQDNKPSVPSSMHMAGLTKSITSDNGHHISFTDNPGGARFLSSFIPVWSLLSKFNIGVDFGHDLGKYLGGGFEIADRLGVYSIKGSTHDRNISISSPVGDISLDAFTGITITAPHGDVKIEGKNVSIEARNNLSIVSGTNIKQPYFGSRGETLNMAKGGVMAMGVGVAKTLGIDFSFHRTCLEVFLRPIGGTMLIKSYRFLCFESGRGEVDLLRGKTTSYLKEHSRISQAFILRHPSKGDSVDNIAAMVKTAWATYNEAVDISHEIVTLVKAILSGNHPERVKEKIIEVRDRADARKFIIESLKNIGKEKKPKALGGSNVKNAFVIIVDKLETLNNKKTAYNKACRLLFEGNPKYWIKGNEIEDIYKDIYEKLKNLDDAATAVNFAPDIKPKLTNGQLYIYTCNEIIKLINEKRPQGSPERQTINTLVQRLDIGERQKTTLDKIKKQLGIQAQADTPQEEDDIPQAKAMITKYNATQKAIKKAKTKGMIENLIFGTLGFKGFIDDRLWGMKDTGSILFSHQKGRTLMLDTDGIKNYNKGNKSDLSSIENRALEILEPLRIAAREEEEMAFMEIYEAINQLFQ